MQPAIGQRCRRCFGIVQVAAHHDVAADGHLADFVFRHWLVVAIEHRDFDAGLRPTDRSQPLQPAAVVIIDMLGGGQHADRHR